MNVKCRHKMQAVGVVTMRMKQLTVRGVDAELDARLRAAARRNDKSLNRTVVALLRKSVGLAKDDEAQEFHDLDHLFGKWSDARARIFEDTLAETRRIDGELWR